MSTVQEVNDYTEKYFSALKERKIYTPRVSNLVYFKCL